MLTPVSRIAAGLVFAATAALIALPACDKKKENSGGGNSGPSAGAGHQGSKGGPPPGVVPPVPPGGAPKQPAAPHLKSNDERSLLASRNNLKQIGLAFHNDHDVMRSFQTGMADSTGKAGLSWRVWLLAYLGQRDLYKQFKVNEPWDSEHNKKLIAQMPKIYAPPGIETHGYTYYRSFSGNGAIMTPTAKTTKPGDPIRGLSITNITDGMSNTILVAEAAEPEIWTKPDDLPFTPGKPPKLGGAVFTDGFNALFCDGSVNFIKSSIDPATLSNLIQTNDGNPVKLP